MINHRISTFIRLTALASSLFCGSLANAAWPPDTTKEPELIFGTVYAPYNDGTLPILVRQIDGAIASIIKEFFAGMIPDVNGMDWPNADETGVDQFTFKLGDSKFRFLLQGVGNLKILNGPILYNSLHGGAGVEYDLISEGTDYAHRTLVALRISPLYGEIAMLRVASGGPEINLPNGVFVGSSFGLEVYKRMGMFQPGFRAYARPEIEIGGSGAGGVAVYSSLYCLIHLSDSDWAPGADGAKATLHLRPEIAYFDRGAEQADLYQWGQSEGLTRTLGDLRRVVQGMLYLEVRY